MQLHQLRYIVKVSELGKFSLAAKELFVTQPTLSQQIINLEKEIGVKLFVRQSKNVQLTPAGKEFVVHAKRILTQVDNLFDLMSNYSTLETGNISVGIMWSASYLGITKIIEEFSVLYPKVNVEIVVDGSQILPQKLKDGEIDVVFYVATEKLFGSEEVVQRQIINSRMMAVISKKNSLSKCGCLEINELSKEKLILPSGDKAFKDIIMKSYIDIGERPDIFCETNLADVRIKFAEENKGITFLTDTVLQNMKLENVVAIPLTPFVERPVYVATRKDELINPVVSKFFSFVAEKYEQNV